MDADTLAFTLEVFNLAGCPPTFVAPGNHDPYSPRSLFWNRLAGLLRCWLQTAVTQPICLNGRSRENWCGSSGYSFWVRCLSHRRWT